MNIRSSEGRETPVPLLRLDTLLGEPQEDYSELIRGVHVGGRLQQWGADALFAKHGLSLHSALVHSPDVDEARSTLRSAIEGTVLVQLGGMDLDRAAHVFGASTYVCVDLYQFPDEIPCDVFTDLSPGRILDGTHPDPDHILSPQVPGRPMQKVSVKADMLDFVSRLPMDSACIEISGIDGDLIPHDAYHAALAAEIVRVVPHGGVVFGRNSSVFNVIHNDQRMESLTLRHAPGTAYRKRAPLTELSNAQRFVVGTVLEKID